MSNFNLNTKIWRYLSFDKFIDLIKTQSLYFSTPDQFDDTWECYPPKFFFNEDHWRSVITTNEHMNDCDHGELLNNTLGYFEAAYYQRDIFGFSCWSKAPVDHAGLWDLYTDKKNAVAISSTPRSIIKSLIADDFVKKSLLIGSVEYIDYESENYVYLSNPVYRFSGHGLPIDKDLIVPYLYKRASYQYEDEVRIVLNKNSSGSLIYPIKRIKFNLKTMIKDIVIAPRANESFKKHVQEILKIELPDRKAVMSSLLFDKPISDRAKKYLESINFRSNVLKDKKIEKYIIFTNRHEFDLWHSKICKKMAIPNFGNFASTGSLAVKAMGTKTWEEPICHPSSKKVLALASEATALGNELVTKAECIKQGWRL